MGTSTITPPPGFELEQPQITPPPGFELESQTRQSPIPVVAGGTQGAEPSLPEPPMNSDAGGKLKGLPGVNPHSPTTGEAIGDVGLATLPITSAVGAGAAGAAEKAFPRAFPMAASLAIGEARKIPYVGKLIPPFAEMAPYLMGGKSTPTEAPAPEGAPPANELTPIQQAWKARGGTLAGERPINHGNPVPFRERPPVQEGATINPSAGAPAVSAPAAPEIAPAPAVNVKPARVGELLNEGLGGRPLQPNVPLRQQMQAKPNIVAAPEGHTAVESSAIKSYSYDPAKREFQSVTPSGATYIHGDVSPEQVAAFESATSKGKAFNQIKQNSVYVGKIVNGQRVNAQPPKALSSATPDVQIATPAKVPAVGEDLTGILQQSLEAARKKRGK